MITTLVVTVLASDRPGLVKQFSDILGAHKANWEESQMAALAGRFAGLLKVTVPEANAEDLTRSLLTLHDIENGIHVLVERGVSDLPVHGRMVVEVVGQDRPGIVQEITRCLASIGANISKMSTEQRDASMASELLFWARIQIELTGDVNEEAVQDALESLDGQLMVDIE